MPYPGRESVAISSVYALLTDCRSVDVIDQSDCWIAESGDNVTHETKTPGAHPILRVGLVKWAEQSVLKIPYVVT